MARFWPIILLGALVVASAGARADDPPEAKDLRAIQACLRAADTAKRGSETCINAVYAPCIGPDENAKSSGELMDCFRRERLVWDQLLNDAFRKLRDGLDDKQRVKLRDMQRAWVDMRDKTCAFYYDYFQGSMANPMMANCDNRETARRAIFLMGFAEDMAGWVKDKRR
jgi:uncharacterized protein YecT (DUF1311 family)